MPINVNSANMQTDQLRSCEAQLAQAKNSIREYQSIISANWQAEEAAHINKAIESVLSEINAAIDQSGSIGSDIRSVADQIKQEEEAAEKARKQAQINKARNDLENA